MKQKINRSNYEEFMIDYLDGTLSVEREAELLLFLEAHPDIKEELEGLDEMVLELEPSSFEFRDGLKKSILDSGNVNADNFEEYCIAYYENDLSEQEAEHLKNYIHDYPSVVQDFELYAKLKLSENSSIEFHNKSQLQQFATESHEAINEENYFDFLIAQHENDLEVERQHELEVFLNKHPQYQRQAQLVASLRLKPDESIVFENKSMLKRRAIFIPITNKWMNVVAASILLFMIFYTFDPRQDIDNPKIIKTTDQSKSTQETEVRNPKIALSEISNTSSDDKQKNIKTTHSIKQAQPKTANINRQVSRSVVTLATVEPMACKGLEVESHLEVEINPFPVDIMAQPKEIDMADNGEKTIVIKGYAGKAVSRISKLLGKSDRLKKERINAQLKNIASVTVNGFNKMTEGDFRLPGQDSPRDEE